MAVRKPLVLVSGEIQQLQSGDTLGGTVAEIEDQTWTNADTGNHVIGDVVYLNAADSVKKALAAAISTAQAIAIATTTITNGTTGIYRTAAILSGLTGLTAGAVYYLSATTAGQMTTTAPSSPGQYVVRLGTAVSTTEFQIKIERPILL